MGSILSDFDIERSALACSAFVEIEPSIKSESDAPSCSPSKLTPRKSRLAKLTGPAEFVSVTSSNGIETVVGDTVAGIIN